MMLITTSTNKYLTGGYVTVKNTVGFQTIKVTRYSGVHTSKQVITDKHLEQATKLKNMFRKMDKDVAVFRKLTGAIVITHKADCDRSHSWSQFESEGSCNLNLNEDVITARAREDAFYSRIS